MTGLDENRERWDKEIRNHTGVAQAPILPEEKVVPLKESVVNGLIESTRRVRLAKLGNEAEHKQAQ